MENNVASRNNLELGQLLKTARKLKSLSQQDVGKALGVTFQQIQKYERGVNRMSVDTLLKLESQLGIRLLEGMDRPATDAEGMDAACSLSGEELDLIKKFRAIKNKKIQKSLINFLQVAAHEG